MEYTDNTHNSLRAGDREDRHSVKETHYMHPDIGITYDGLQGRLSEARQKGQVGIAIGKTGWISVNESSHDVEIFASMMAPRRFRDDPIDI